MKIRVHILCAVGLLCVSHMVYSAEIHRAAMDGDLEKVKTLLKNDPALAFSKTSTNDPMREYERYGPSPCYGYTPLHVAALQGHREIAELLLAHKAEVNARDNADLTPLHMAVQPGRTNLVELLLSSGADVNARDVGGSTPLHLAANHARKEVVELLLAAKADVSAKDAYGYTPLHLVVQRSDAAGLQTAEVLLANGAVIDAACGTGDTPLHFAAVLGRVEAVKLLIARKADVNAKNQGGETPLAGTIRSAKMEVTRPVRDAQQEVIEILREHGGHQ